MLARLVSQPPPSPATPWGESGSVVGRAGLRGGRAGLGGAGEGEGKPREGGRGGWSGAGAGGRIAIGVIGLDACGVIASSCRPGRGAVSSLRLRLRLRMVLGALSW